jgi:hypothetical protein
MAQDYGGYLAYPRSRNYIAYDSSSMNPPTGYPESLLPAEEPTPQKLNFGQRCGMTSGGERDYNKPQSRSNFILPLNIQEVYLSGSDIEVTIKTFGLSKSGGHFEFSICALTYPEEPTEECFQQNPLEFVEDHYYGAVKDELYPERAYVPFGGNSMRTTPLVPSGEDSADGMEFKYTFKLPENFSSTSDQQEIIGSDATTFSIQEPIRTHQVTEEPPPKGDVNNYKRSIRFNGNVISGGMTGNGAVLISAMVTDGNGKTTIVSMNEPPIIHENGPAVEATAICTFGDAQAISGGGNFTSIPEEIKRICGEVFDSNGFEGDSDYENDVITAATPSSSDSGTKYALLRWRYQTAPDCFPSGYDTYSWPKEWGQWEPQWGGECDDNKSQEEYWNCAEVLVLNEFNSTSEPFVADSAAPTGLPTASVSNDSLAAESAAPTGHPTARVFNISLVAVNDAALTGVDQPIEIDVLANDEVSGYAKPHITNTSNAVHGDCQVSDDEVLYMPNVGFVGWDQCRYTVCIEYDVCDEAFVNIKVVGGDVIPETEVQAADLVVYPDEDIVVNPDEAVVVEGSSVDIDVLENDEGRDGDSLEILWPSSPLHGIVEVIDNRIRYTSRAGFTGTDSFMYSACDSYNRCDSAGVVVTIIAEVLAVDDSVTTLSAPILIDVTANDSSSSSVRASLIVTHVSEGKHGSCSITASNKVRYIPNEMYSGWDWCDYNVCAGSACDQGRIDIHVLPDTTAPSPSPVESMQEASIQFDLEKVYAQDDRVATFINVPIEADVTLNDFVKGMGTLTITQTGESEHGACKVTNDNKVLYSPIADFEGSDKCVYIVCDISSNMCDEGLLRIDVTNISRQFQQTDQISVLPSSTSRLRSGMNSAENEYSSTAGTTIFPATADTFATIEFPDTNYGLSGLLFVSSASSSAGLRDTMLKFNTPSIDDPFCEYGVESATVSIYSLAHAGDGGTLITTSNKFWAEAKVTWNDAPVGDGIVIADLRSVEVDTWYDIDVLSAVNLGDPLSIRMISHVGGESVAVYASRNHQDESLHPILKITCLFRPE